MEQIDYTVEYEQECIILIDMSLEEQKEYLKNKKENQNGTN
jgi:hypothetical protein